MSISVVQTNIENAASSGTTIAATYTANVAAGNLLVAVVGCGGSSTAPTGVSDSVNGAWTKAIDLPNSGIGTYASIWSFKGTAGGGKPLVTATFAASASFPEIVIFEVSSTTGWRATLLDGTASANTSGTTGSPGAITTTNASDILFSYAVVSSNVTAGNTGWTFYKTTSNADGVEFIVETATGSYTGSFTTSPSTNWCIVACAFAATVSSSQSITPTGIASVTAFGSETVTQPGAPQTLTPTGIASVTAFGNTSVVSVVPVLVQHTATSLEACLTFSGTVPVNYISSTLTVNLPNPTLSGNALILGIQWAGGGTITSVKDSAGNSFTTGPSLAQSATYNTLKGAIFYLIGCASGLSGVTITFAGTGTVNQPQVVLSEWQNITGVDSGVQASSNSSLSPGTLTPTAAGDLIYYFGIDIGDNVINSNTYAPGFAGTSITPGSGFTPLSMDLMWGYLDQYMVAPSTASVTPSATTSGSALWGSLAMAFKAGAAGTAPSATAMRIVRTYFASLSGPLTTSPHTISKLLFPCQGNSLAVVYNGGNAGFSGITDSKSNTWTTLAAYQNNSNGAIAQAAYCQNATADPALALTFSWPGTSDGGPMVCLYDIVNGATTGLFDKSATTGGQQTTNTNLTTNTITPAKTGGLVLEVVAVAWNTITSAVTAGMTFDGPVESKDCNNQGTNGTGPSAMSEDNGYAHFYPSATSALTFVYGITTFASAGGGISGVEEWSAMAISLNPATTGGPQTLTPTGIASTTAFGNFTVTQPNAPQSITPTGIASVTAFGVTSLGPALPVLVQHVATSLDACLTFGTSIPVNFISSSFIINLPNLTLSGNTLVLGLQWAGGGTIASVKDSAGNSFTLGPSFAQNATYNTLKGAIYYLVGCAAALNQVTVTFAGTGTVNSPQGVLSEWANVTGVDTGIQSANNSSLSPGALTPSVTGDLLYYFGIDIGDNVINSNTYAPGFVGTSITPGSGWTPLSMDLMWGYIDQYMVASSTASVSPSATVSGSAVWGSLAMAFRCGPAGTTPSVTAMRIVRRYSVSLSGPTTSSHHTISKLLFPCQGNTLLLSYNAGVAGFSGITDSKSNTWTTEPAYVFNSNGCCAQMAFAQNATPDPNLALTIAWPGTSDGGPMAYLFDIVNGPATGLFDKKVTSGGAQTSNGNLTTNTITPARAGGIVFEVVPVTWNTLTSAVSAGMFCDADIETKDCNNQGTGGTGPSPLSEDNGYGHFYPTSASPLTFVYGTTTFASVGGGISGVQDWSAMAISLNPALTGGAQNLTPAGIASTTAFGNAMVTQPNAPQSVTPAGIASVTAFGSFAVLQPQTGHAWISNGADTGGSGSYVAGTQSVQFILNNFAANGDTIMIPAGSFTWTTGVTCNLSVSIIGSSYTPSTSTNGVSPGAPTLSSHITYNGSGVALNVTNATAGSYFRLSGVSFAGISNANANYLSIGGSTTTDPFRIDNCTFDVAGNNVTAVQLGGNQVGSVFDHCSFLNIGQQTEMIHNLGMGAGSTAGWTDNLTPGSNQLIYFEDCLWQEQAWNTQQYQYSSCAMQTYYGGRNCARWSTTYNSLFDQHGNVPPNYGTRWFEFYNLTQIVSAANQGSVHFMDLRSGSGFVYNLSANLNGQAQTPVLNFYSDQATPCTCGPGNGIFVGGSGHVPDNSSPVYCWALNNGIVAGVSQNGISGANDIAMNRNIFVSTTQPTNMTVWQTSAGAISNYVYTPYTYPHPLIARTTSGAQLLSPTGIASTTAFGTTTVIGPPQTVSPTGIASTTALGTTTVSRGQINLAPTGIGSTTAFGTVTLTTGTANLAPVGISSTTAFGVPTIGTSSTISPTGIGSTTAFGVPTVAILGQGIFPAGIASTTALGSAFLVRGLITLTPAGIASTTAFGVASVTVAAALLTPAGIASTTVFGQITITQTGPGAVSEVVPPYAGQDQTQSIDVPAWIAYREPPYATEEGPWAMPPYALLYPPEEPAPTTDVVPPPLSKTALWDAMQTWPL